MPSFDFGVDAALERCFDAVVAGLTLAGFAVPDRRYVTAGEVAYDCNQLAVALEGLFVGLPNQPQVGPGGAHAGYIPWTVAMAVTYTLCVPVPSNGVPAAADLSAKGHEIASAAGLIAAVLTDTYLVGNITDPCNGAALGPTAFIGPDGGVFGVSVGIQVQVV